MKIEVNPNVFFIVGMTCFLVIGTFNLVDFLMFSGRYTFFTGGARVAGIIFNFILVGFFYYLYKQANPTIKEEYASDDITDLIKKIKEEEHEKKTRGEPGVSGEKELNGTSKRNRSTKT